MSWIRARSGSKNFPAQLHARLGRIAYLGASVTVQQQGYRPLLHLKLVELFDRPHLPVNVGIGGIGVIGGVFLMDELVLRRRPAYCFIEFSTADYAGPIPLQESAAALEGVLRKLAAIDCKACLLHLYRADLTYAQRPPIVAAFEAVAETYQAPSLHVGALLAEQFDAGLLERGQLYKDLVHTTPAGASQVAELVLDGLCTVWNAAPQQSHAAALTAPPLHPHHYQSTAIVFADPDMVVGDGEWHLGRFRDTYAFVQVGFANALVLQCADTLVGMVVVVGPEAGVVEVTSPAGTQRYQLWDQWCHYDRLQTVLFWPHFAQGTRLQLRLVDVPVDKSGVSQPDPPGGERKKALKVIGFMVKK